MQVRALFYCYKPLKERLISPNQVLQDPHKVIGKVCLSAWTAKRNSTYRFCFKLYTKKAPNSRVILEEEIQKDCREHRLVDDWEFIEDQSETLFQQAKIGRDPEEDNQMLFMDSNNFSLLPGSFSGLKIHGIKVTSSGEGFRYQKAEKSLPVWKLLGSKGKY